MATFRLQIVSPEGCPFDAQAEALRLCTSEGYVSIRAQHADYIATLGIGIVTLTTEGTSKDAACGGGFVTVEKGAVRLVATSFEYADEIDVERAEQAKLAAEQILAESKDHEDIKLAKARLARAVNRLKIAK